MRIKTRTTMIVATAGALVLLGGAGLALAQTVGSPGASDAAGTTAHGHHPARQALTHALHAQWVTRDEAGVDITWNAIRGSVTAVTGSSITARAADGVTETFTVTSATKVHLKGQAKGSGSQIGGVKVGDGVGVVGTGTGSLTAVRVGDTGAPASGAAPSTGGTAAPSAAPSPTHTS